MTDPLERAKALSGEGKTYADIAKVFNREDVQWSGEGRNWTRGDIENLMSHGSPDSASNVTDVEATKTAEDDVEIVPESDALSADDDLAAIEPTSILVAASDVDTDADLVGGPSQAVAGASSEVPKRKWHDRKWLLVAVVSIVGVILGAGIALPDRQAAKDERKKILADAKSDASDMRSDAKGDASDTKSDARGDADEIVATAKEEREKLLGGVKKEKADLLVSIKAAKGQLAGVNATTRTAKANLATTERTRASKQNEVNELNRAIRASTSLSRENAVASASQYLSNQSFSCQGLIDQLQFEDYSASDATAAAKEVGLC